MDPSKWNVEKDYYGGWMAWEPMKDPFSGGIQKGQSFPRWREAYSYARRRVELEQTSPRLR